MIESLGANGKKPPRPARTGSAAVPGGKGKQSAASAAKEPNEPLLAAQIQAEASVSGSLAAQQANLQNAGACLENPISFTTAPNGLHGLAADLANLFEGFQLLAGDPGNLETRDGIVRCAHAVAVQFNYAASRLHAVKIDLDVSIQRDVERANQLLDDVAALNRRILATQAEGSPAQLLVDQRERSLETLSGLHPDQRRLLSPTARSRCASGLSQWLTARRSPTCSPPAMIKRASGSFRRKRRAGATQPAAGALLEKSPPAMAAWPACGAGWTIWPRN